MSGPALKQAASDELRSQWVDGLHEALADAKMRLARSESLSRERLEPLMRSFHLIKGYAQALGLHGVQAAAHGLESRMVGILSSSAKATSSPRLSETELRALLLEGVGKLDTVLEKLHELMLQSAANGERESCAPRAVMLSSFLGRYEGVGVGIALDLGVRLELRFKGGQDIVLQKPWEAPLDAALLHAFRNSLGHGLVPGSKQMRIEISVTCFQGEVAIECRDWGVGIDPNRVRDMARQRQVRFDAEMGTMSDEEVLQLLFLPGFSLSRGINPLSGRGYGLNIVREAIEGRLRGHAKIISVQGQGTTLVLRFPLVSRS